MKNWSYFKIFGEKDACAPKRPALFELFGVLSELKGKGNSLLPAGYTYFGQFIDHDVSWLLENAILPDPRRPSGPVDVKALTLGRKPALDLDSMYGAGLSDSVVPFDDDGKFVLGNAGFGNNRDFKRDPLLRPLIADRRNDENLLVAQLQVVFMNLHNKIVDALPPLDCAGRFKRAREEVVKIYQYLVLHDFLPRLVPDSVYKTVFLEDKGQLNKQKSPAMALEFSEAAFRLHALVRPFYSLNLARDAGLGQIFDMAGAARRAGDFSRPLLRAEDEVDWRLFFPFNPHPAGYAVQKASQVTPVLSPSLLDLPSESGRPANMLELNILRGIGHGLCSGQDAVAAVKVNHPDVAGELDLGSVSQTNYLLSSLSAANSIRTATPLWLYLTLEAAGRGGVGDLGGWLLADTLRAAALNADVRLPHLTNPSPQDLYGPFLLATGSPKTISISDVIKYAYN